MILSTDLIDRVSSLDALRVYIYLLENHNEKNLTSYDRIAHGMNQAGKLTQRGAEFTASVVSNRVAELESDGLVEREKPEIKTPYFFLCFRNENEDVVGKGQENESAYKEYKINKQINTFKTCDCVSTNRPERQPKVPAQPAPPTVSDALASVDLSDETSTRNRETLKVKLWDKWIHAELYDRAIAAVKLGLTSFDEVLNAIADAHELNEEYRRTNCFKGERTLWKTFGRWVKGWYDSAGYQWTPTSNKREPAPVRRGYVADDDAAERRILAADARARRLSAA